MATLNATAAALPLPGLPVLPWYGALYGALGGLGAYVAVLFVAQLLPTLLWLPVFLAADRSAEQNPKGFWGRRRLGPRPPKELTAAALREHIVGQLVTPAAIAAIYALEVAIFGRDGMDAVLDAAAFPDAATAVAQLVVVVVVQDAFFYWGHRLMHWPPLYFMHKRHHEFHQTDVAGTHYEAPWELLPSVFLPYLVAPFGLRLHLLLRAAHLLFAESEAIVSHCGYDMPRWVPGSAAMHAYHHSHNIGAFATAFPFWDWATGTDRSFVRWLGKRRQQMREANQRCG